MGVGYHPTMARGEYGNQPLVGLDTDRVVPTMVALTEIATTIFGGLAGYLIAPSHKVLGAFIGLAGASVVNETRAQTQWLRAINEQNERLLQRPGLWK